ncbi:hypothetical protein DS885_05940 [Psychromonas sp. B3M02]|uniref:aminotransferase family protein n=1 Tax=Psychromonas sp. B3M02 TaxID=2267226 RepID=UPI000DE807BF|nr:aminotransferase class III-fold pyridoxal phosphate-dependent enzyme [Psychromonas sp. B3M02]RBW46891.1 hypothetical protein DS885_05940 [Psychromonas sp. B3M02]
MDNSLTSQWVEDFEGSTVPDTIISSGKGGWAKIVGHDYAYEAVSGHSCLNLGHAHPELIEAATEGLKTLSYCSPEHQSYASIELSNRLSDLLGGSYKIKYAISGSSANEMALNIARKRWQALGFTEKTVCLSLDRSYHGNLGQAKQVTGFAPFKVDTHITYDDFVYISSARNASTGTVYSLSEIRAQLEAKIAEIGQDRIACLFVEPVGFAGGVIIPPKGYLKLLRSLCDQYQISLVVDEVITGFGRTGTWFGFQQEGIRPDMVTMGKGITAGYFPLAAVAVDEPIYDDLLAHNMPLKMVITMAGHPTGCSIALKAIEIIQRDNLCNKIADNEQRINAYFSQIKQQPILQDIRGFGHMWGLEFCDYYGYSAAELANSVAEVCQQNACIVAAADGIIRINPPLNINQEECDMMSQAIVNAVNSVTNLVKVKLAKG